MARRRNAPNVRARRLSYIFTGAVTVSPTSANVPEALTARVSQQGKIVGKGGT